MMRKPARRPAREPTIALINVVFLMLVFFMVSGTLAQPLDTALKLVRTADLDGIAPPDDLVVHADGRLEYRGAEITSAAGYLARISEEGLPAIRIVPDRDLPARDLVSLARELRQGGAGKILIVTERGLE